MRDQNEPFGGRYWGIFNVEGDIPEPLMLFWRKDAADRELARRRALDPEDDDRLTEWHQVFRCDIWGAWWNSYEPDPRADSPMSVESIHALHTGEVS